MDFVHLRLHTEYSVSDSTVRVSSVVKNAAEDGQGALALTDLGNLFGWVKFYQAARRAGIKPLVGADTYIRQSLLPDATYAIGSSKSLPRIVFLAQNQTGYLNLCQILSRAWLEGADLHGRALVDFSWLTPELTQGLIVLSGGYTGDVSMALLMGNRTVAKDIARAWQERFSDRYYLEIQRFDAPNEAQLLSETLDIAHELSIPLVATHPTQFLTSDDFIAHEARVCIAQGEILSNPRRELMFTKKQYFRTRAQMVAEFSDIPSALANSVEIAKRCTVNMTLGKAFLPKFPTPNNEPLDQYIQKIATDGLWVRLRESFPNETNLQAQCAHYFERLDFELSIINRMGFPGYFLIVADFINWAKNNGVPVGPGRGSGAGSLVAYSLRITDLDPLRYHLLFERFLNPERVSMPDFDIDFCQNGRDKVITYVKEKYGRDAVSQIATFGTMAARAAIRDIGRVLDLGYNFTDGVAKLIPNKPGKPMTIAQAIVEEPQLMERQKQEEEVAQLLELAQRVEGLVRNVGMHAGGVLIAPGRLTDFCPLYSQDGGQNVVSQFDKDDVEAVGLVKFDFLGLATLTILEETLQLTRQLDENLARLTLEAIPLTDSKTFDLLKVGNTVAVFQLESSGMQGMLKDAKPDCFEDIIALVALYRPGPMSLIPEFCARKHGRAQVVYPDPRAEMVLKETYGIMVYQEQVMQLAQTIAGYSLGEADLLRRAMGKKKAEEMAMQRARFKEGAVRNQLTEEKADEIFDLMEKFAEYGFNKSHAACYALLAYQTAWFKAHYPAAFFAANMTLSSDDTDKLKILYDDAIKNQLEILPPDINASTAKFGVVNFTQVRYGLAAIKGTGWGAVESIVQARQCAPFVSLLDFCIRVDRRVVNRRAMEALICAGAFDGINPHRAALLAQLEPSLQAADQIQAKKNQNSLFGDEDFLEQADWLAVTADDWTVKQKLQHEKTALGFYLSGHLFSEYQKEARQIVRQTLAHVKDGRDVWVVGIATNVRTQMTQRGKLWFVTLDDGEGQLEVSFNEAVYRRFQLYIQEDELLFCKGSVKLDSFTGGFRMYGEVVQSLGECRAERAKAIEIHVDQPTDDFVKKLLSGYQQFQERGVPALSTTGQTVRYFACIKVETLAVKLSLHGLSAVFPSEEWLRYLKSLPAVTQVNVVY